MTTAQPRRRAGTKARIAFVNTHPIQYFAPLYRAINQSHDMEAVPIYLSDMSLRGGEDKDFGQAVTWDVDLISGTNPIFVAGSEKRDVGSGLTMVAPGIFRAIKAGGFHALVIHGHSVAANHLAVLAAKLGNIPVFTRGETHLKLKRGGFKRFLRGILMPIYYGRFDGVLAIGTLNRAFYLAMQVPEAKIFDFPYTVDNERLESSAKLSEAERAAVRERLGLSNGRPAVLFAAKFQHRKHPDDLIRACAQLRDEGIELDLVMVGSGEMESQLRALASAHPKLNVVFTGFVNQNDLPSHFAACDIFVLPSENEPFGLAINEAMCAGLPVVASREIGSVPDLVHHDRNGFVFDAGDVPGLASALRPLLTDADLRRRMGLASLEIIRTWSYERCIAGLRRALVASGVLHSSPSC